VGPLQEGIQTVVEHVLEAGFGAPQEQQGRRKKKKKSGIGSGMVFRGDNTISHVFHDVELLACGGDQNSGVLFETTFALPPSLASFKRKDRQEFTGSYCCKTRWSTSSAVSLTEGCTSSLSRWPDAKSSDLRRTGPRWNSFARWNL